MQQNRCHKCSQTSIIPLHIFAGVYWCNECIKDYVTPVVIFTNPVSGVVMVFTQKDVYATLNVNTQAKAVYKAAILHPEYSITFTTNVQICNLTVRNKSIPDCYNKCVIYIDTNKYSVNLNVVRSLIKPVELEVDVNVDDDYAASFNSNTGISKYIELHVTIRELVRLLVKNIKNNLIKVEDND